MLHRKNNLVVKIYLKWVRLFSGLLCIIFNIVWYLFFVWYMWDEKVVDKKYSGENFSYHLPDYKIKDICKTLINPVEDKKYKKLIEKFESLF